MSYTRLFASCLTGSALLLGSVSAYAYDFDESCAPTTLHDSSKTRPDTLIMLDNSCSMNNDAGNGQTKMEVSRTVIGELADAVSNPGTCTASDQSGCDDVFLGVGWFSIEAGVDVPPADDTAAAVKDAVNNYPFKCQTQHGAGAKAIYNSTELATSDRLGVAIMLTDGAPYQLSPYGNHQDTVEETLHYLCAARERPTPTVSFMVGFGSGTNQRINNLFAAAGGSGQCCLGTAGTPCTYQPTEFYDPCRLPRRNATQLDVSLFYAAGSLVQCKGAIQADTGQELKDTMLDLLDQAACTFPLEIPGDYLRAPSADEDPEATRVEFDHAVLGNNIRVTPLDPGNPNAFRDYLVNQRGIATSVADQYIGEGWSFGDPLRRSVTLTDKLCQEVLSDNVELTETQVACLCANTGSDCEVPCEDGDSDGYDDNNGSLCEENASGDMIQAGRCQYGTVDCVIGVEYCTPNFSMQPDICNGIDDDCDGITDNSTRANPAYTDSQPGDTPGQDAFEWDGNESELTSRGLDKGLFCGFQDMSCRCDLDGPHDINDKLDPGNPDPDYEWKQFLDSTAAQIDRCVCEAGLEVDSSGPEVAQTPEEDTAPQSSGAACNSIPGAPASPGTLLLFLGFFAAFFRRRRS